MDGVYHDVCRLFGTTIFLIRLYLTVDTIINRSLAVYAGKESGTFFTRLSEKHRILNGNRHSLLSPTLAQDINTPTHKKYVQVCESPPSKTCPVIVEPAIKEPKELQK